MFGFVTFVYPETVKLILAKGNPHFVCDARVLVKPYKEKGKVPEKYRHCFYDTLFYSLLVPFLFSPIILCVVIINLISWFYHRSKNLQAERGDFSGCSSPTGLLDSRDPFELLNLGI
jgi:hypothetical protein